MEYDTVTVTDGKTDGGSVCWEWCQVCMCAEMRLLLVGVGRAPPPSRQAGWKELLGGWCGAHGWRPIRHTRDAHTAGRLPAGV